MSPDRELVNERWLKVISCCLEAQEVGKKPNPGQLPAWRGRQEENSLELENEGSES